MGRDKGKEGKVRIKMGGRVKMSSQRKVVLFSGGLDSTGALLWALSSEPLALTFSYGQVYTREIDAARTITKVLGVEHVVLNLPVLPLRSPEDPYVLSRNAIFISLASSFSPVVITGIVPGAYPDTSRRFLVTMENALSVGQGRKVRVVSPFTSKREMIEWARKEGRRLKVLKMSYSCYTGGMQHCGKCRACEKREEALNGL